MNGFNPLSCGIKFAPDQTSPYWTQGRPTGFKVALLDYQKGSAALFRCFGFKDQSEHVILIITHIRVGFICK